MRLVEYYSVIDKDIQVKIIDCANQKVLYEGGITTPYNDLDDTFMTKEVVKISASYEEKRKSKTITASQSELSNLIDVIIPILDIYIDTRTQLEIFISDLFNRIERQDIIESKKEVFINFHFTIGSNNYHVWTTDTVSFAERNTITSSDEFKTLLDVYGDSKFNREIKVTKTEILDGTLEYKDDIGRRVYNITVTFNPHTEEKA